MYDVHREETFEFPITDENDTACSAIFYMDEEGSQKQIGDEQTYILNLLKKGKPIFKGTRVYTDGRTESARMTPRTTQISIANVCTYSLTLFACVRACVRVCVCVCVCGAGLIVPGGKVDMLFTAYGFGKEDVEDDDDGAFDMMGDGDGAMMMDSDEDED